MKVLLINATWEVLVSRKGKRYNRFFPPLDLLTSAALLEKEGIEVEVFDANISGLSPSEIAHHASRFDKVFITSTPYYNWQCPNIDFDVFLNFIKPFNKKNLYLMGTHCSVYPEKVLQLTEVAGIIRGEPEYTILEICQDKASKDIQGLTFKMDGGIISNPDRDLPPLDQVPMPAYHLLNPKKYGYELLGDNLMVFEGSRGCPYKCIFCLQVMYGNRYRRKNVSKLIAEVDYAVQKLGVENGYFYDLEFTLNKDLVNKLCDHLIKKKYNFSWTCQTRADSVDPQILKKMKEAGCKLIHFGVETGSEKILELLNKKITLQQIKQGIEMTKQAGIETAGFFLFGFPGETEVDFMKTIDIAKRLDLTYTSFHVAIPYPGTEFFNLLETNNSCLDFPEAYTKEHPLEELKSVARKAFLQFYLRPKYIFSRIFKGNPRSWLKQLRLFINFVK